MSANDLSTLLWRERELLELLLFKLEEEQLLLTAGKAKWLPFATREVEQGLGRLRKAGMERTVESAAVAAEGGLRGDANLPDLVCGIGREHVWTPVTPKICMPSSA